MNKGYDFSSLKVDLLQIVERRLGAGKKKGKEYLFSCPFHNFSAFGWIYTQIWT